MAMTGDEALAQCVFACTEPMCKTLDEAGVPRDLRWRTLVLYIQHLQEFGYLTPSQREELQGLLARLMARGDFSERAFNELMRKQEAIFHASCTRKLQAAIEETVEMVKEFSGLLNSHSEGVEQLENLTMDTIRADMDPEEAVRKLKTAFQGVVEGMREDALNLTKMSKTDALTSLGNRRAFDEYMDEAVPLAKEQGTPFSLLMLDIDHFKKFNDRYGHRIGDQALITVAKIIGQFESEALFTEGMGYFAARYGGEEFVVALPGVSQEEAVQIAEQIRVNIMGYNFIIRDSKGQILERGIKITVSIGVAELCAAWKGALVENLIEFADKGLYKAKGAGRNQVAVADGIECVESINTLDSGSVIS